MFTALTAKRAKAILQTYRTQLLLAAVMVCIAVMSARSANLSASGTDSAALPASVPALIMDDDFDQLVKRCAPDVHPATMRALVTVESSHNPYAIGVVDGALERQPRSRGDALATIQALEARGANFSIGLAQVNRYNLAPYNQTYETILDECTNVSVGAAILKDCYIRAAKKQPDEQKAVRDALSCYYSGNFRRGYVADGDGTSYVGRVVASARPAAQKTVPAIDPSASVPTLTAPKKKNRKPEDEQWAFIATEPEVDLTVPDKPKTADNKPEMQEKAGQSLPWEAFSNI